MYKELNNIYAFRGNVDDAIFSPEGGPNVNPLDGFNEDLYDYYINTGKYTEAARYAKMYPPLDIKERHAQELSINKLIEDGERQKNILGKFQKQDQDMIKFSQSVFNKQSFDKLGQNDYVNRFNELKAKAVTNGSNVDSSRVINDLEVTFSPHKKKFLFWDIENDNSYENFLYKSGLTEEYLKSKDVNVVDNGDGSYTMKFNYNGDIANSLLYNLAKYSNDSDYIPIYGDQSLKIKAYDIDGKPMDTIGRVIGDNLPIESNTSFFLDVYKDYIDKQKSKSDKLTEQYAQTSSSVNYGQVSDRVFALQQLYQKVSDSGTRSKIENMIKFEEDNIISILRKYPFESEEVYSNLDNNTPVGPLQLTSLDNSIKLKRWFLDYVDNASGDDVLRAVSLGESGGRFGVFIDIPAKFEKRLIDNGLNHDFITVFVPGLFAEEAQKKAYRDTSYRSVRKLDDLEAYNGDYTLQDGRKIITNRVIDNYNTKNYHTEFYLEDKGVRKQVDKDYLQPLIEQDYIVDNIYEELFWQYHNSDGKIINYEKLKKELEFYAVTAANTYLKYRENIDLEKVFNDNPNELADPDELGIHEREKWEAALQIYARVIKKLKEGV